MKLKKNIGKILIVSSIFAVGVPTLTVLTTSCVRTLSDITAIVKTRDLGGIENNEDATIKEYVELANPIAGNLKWSQLQITAITSTSAYISAKEDSTAYTGYVKVSFSLLSGATDLSSLITINELGEIETNSQQAIQTKIVELNNINLTWSQIEITNITTTTAHVAAKSTSDLYNGFVDVEFTLPPVITNISSIVTITNLGQIINSTIPVIQSGIVAANSSASNLAWDQIEITGISNTTAHIAAKSTSTLYFGSVDVVFTLPPVLLDISSVISVVNLQEIASATALNIKAKIIALNSSTSSLTWDQIEFTEISTTSAHVAAKADSTLYTGYVDVVFTTTPGIEYNAQGTNWIGYEGGFITCILNSSNNTCVISACNNYVANNLVFPNIIIDDGIPYSITAINDSVFDARDTLTGSLTLPNTIISIGAYAFRGCEALAGTLTLPNSITSIGNAAFQHCQFKGRFSIPDKLIVFPDSCFDGCKFTGDLIIPDRITAIGKYAFRDCTGYTGDLMIPASVNNISASAFHGCTGINSIVCSYPAQPTIDSKAFLGMRSTGTIQNTNAAYSSSNLCAYLIASGSLPSGWTPA